MVQGQLAGRDWTSGRTLEDQLLQGKLWAEDSVDLVLEGRWQLFGVALCVSWGTDAAAWPRMEGFAVVACGESFVVHGGQTARSVDAAAQGAAHGLGYIQVRQVSAPGLVLNRSVSPGDPTHHQSRYPKSLPPRFTIGRHRLHEPRDAEPFSP